MAKGQMKSNKEAKKPKQEKAKPAAAASDLTARLGTPQSKPKSGKK